MQKQHIVSRFLLRAPALPVTARAAQPEARPQTLENAVRLAAPGLPTGKEGDRARARYLARMAFRTAPAGLLGGVCVGEIGERTQVALADPSAHIDVSYAAVRSLARSLLDEPDVRERVSLRQAPSLMHDEQRATWLAFGEGGEARVERAAIDPLLARAIAATERAWSAWPRVRRAVRQKGLDGDSVDDWLLQLIDGGLLVVDLFPPLVGERPLVHLAKALSRVDHALGPSLIGLADELALLRPLDDDSLTTLLEKIAANFSRARSASATLTFAPRHAQLDRRALERAAAIAPLLFRLQRAFGAISERAMSPRFDETLATLVEQYGPGCLPLAPLALGHYGVELGANSPSALASELPPFASPSSEPWAQLPQALLQFLVEKLVTPSPEVALTVDELESLLPPSAAPDTFELVLSPAREQRGARPGDGWLLGLHGPAGATWGRFAGALDLQHAFDELSTAERAQGAHAAAMDVDFSPSADVADAAAHPRLRGTTLALSSWPESGEVVRPRDLLVSLDGADGADGLALFHRDGRSLRALSTTRIRSTTVEEGAFRLLVGFGLVRAVAPWALHLGPLAQLPRLPRVTLDGFVIAPASWRISDELAEACRGKNGPSAIAAWRERASVPREVQIGFEDQLLPVDLEAADAPQAIAQLERDSDGTLPRAHEIWPPLDCLVDEGGRRVEAVVAVVSPHALEDAGAPTIVASDAIDPNWATYFLYGAPDRADHLLLGGLLPAIERSLARGEIDRWFFLRYVDEPGPRHHLRVRVRCKKRSGLLQFQKRLQLDSFRSSGDLSSVMQADYRPERARYGEHLELAEKLFQVDSELAIALLALDPDVRPPACDLLVRSYDALCRGFGLGLAERRAVADGRRAAVADQLQGARDSLAPLYRERQAVLSEALRSDEKRGAGDVATVLFRAHAARVRRLARPQNAEILPALLHLCAVRLVGLGGGEAIGYYLWERALEGLAARAR